MAARSVSSTGFLSSFLRRLARGRGREAKGGVRHRASGSDLEAIVPLPEWASIASAPMDGWLAGRTKQAQGRNLSAAIAQARDNRRAG